MSDLSVANYIIKQLPAAADNIKWVTDIDHEIKATYSPKTSIGRLQSIENTRWVLADKLGIPRDHPDLTNPIMFVGSPKKLANKLAKDSPYSEEVIFGGLGYLVMKNRIKIVGGGQGRFVVFLTRRSLYDPNSEAEALELFEAAKAEHDPEALALLEQMFKARNDEIQNLNKQMTLMSKNTWL